MAIFRAGKRVGPFDIRVGFPRDRSLENVDRDPRLRQRANTENTIGRFRAMMGRAEGYARTARFAVRIYLPANLGSMIATNTTTSAPPAAQTSAVNNDGVRSLALQQLATQMGQQVNLHCDSISMPGHDLQAQDVQHGSSPARSMVQSHAFAGNINATFYADKYLRERHFFEAWQKMAVDMVTHKANYYDDYVGKMQIFQLGSLDGEGDRDVPTYGIEAIEVYPATIGAVEYSYANSNQIAKINVAFAYKQWYNLTTDAIAGMEFGSGQQTLHDIKSRDPGLIGLLPPELQRAGRSVFNQAKTQFPIGKIFKGKVFPPFT
tara:strand:+ start:37 stop:996 length:960 start_codon:yes stop_codon:yes gene_type:complete